MVDGRPVARRSVRIERFHEGDAWVLDAVADPTNSGLDATAGMGPATMKGWLPGGTAWPGMRSSSTGSATVDGPGVSR